MAETLYHTKIYEIKDTSHRMMKGDVLLNPICIAIHAINKTAGVYFFRKYPELEMISVIVWWKAIFWPIYASLSNKKTAGKAVTSWTYFTVWVSAKNLSTRTIPSCACLRPRFWWIVVLRLVWFRVDHPQWSTCLRLLVVHLLLPWIIH